MSCSSRIIFILISILISLNISGAVKENDIRKLWLSCDLEEVVSYDIFNTAMKGLNKIEEVKNKSIITIIDFSKPSTEKRFFVIDLTGRKLLFKTYVAHGKNSGEKYAIDFSNDLQSLKSSPGFYLTGETYSGRHGYSMSLIGLEKGINDNARIRDIVIHGAEYVNEDYIKLYGRLGRSWGCPALPVGISKDVIDIISGGTCLFIYTDNDSYKLNSEILKNH